MPTLTDYQQIFSMARKRGWKGKMPPLESNILNVYQKKRLRQARRRLGGAIITAEIKSFGTVIYRCAI